MVIGDPIEHSLSPQMHNAGYEALGIDSQFVYVACRVTVEAIPDFINGVRAMHIKGVSCTIPHKIAVMKYLDEIDEVAKKIGAVNTIVNDDGVLQGYNTDWLGVLTPLEKLTSLKNKSVALLGAGGAARAVAYAVVSKGATLTVYNRTIIKAKLLAKDFGAVAKELHNYKDICASDIIINTTSVGLDNDETPIPKEYINKNHIVFDAVYGKKETQLIQDAKEKGAQIITGKQMLLHQGSAQFTLFTGYVAPTEAIEKILL